MASAASAAELRTAFAAGSKRGAVWMSTSFSMYPPCTRIHGWRGEAAVAAGGGGAGGSGEEVSSVLCLVRVEVSLAMCGS